MAGQTPPYVFGNTARKIAPQPYYNNEEEIRRRQQERIERKKRAKPRRRLDKVSVLLTCITFVAVMVVSIFYLHTQFQSTYLRKNVIQLEREIVELEKVNKASTTELENTVDLKGIYKKATRELGMRKATQDQIYTYDSKKSTQIRQHGSIPAQ